MTILVTGGAGYIGSIMTRQLLDANHEVIVYDDLSNGHQDAVDSRASFVKGSLGDRDSLKRVFENNEIQAVIHFAGVLSVGESMKRPEKYFTVNTYNTTLLLQLMHEYTVSFIIFSSTAGVYGNPQEIPIKENHPKKPTNPYGESKLMIERILHWFDVAHNIKSASLRYFNAAGASLDGKLGERHKDETHIIPLAINAVVKQTPFSLYGTDYDTKDGTCIRDYIHVEDLCSAHLIVLEHLVKHSVSNVYNVGTGNGYSNKEVLDTIERVVGKPLVIRKEPRRAGDPIQLIADASKIKNELSWQPKHSNLPTIIKTAWEFHKEKEIAT